MFREAIRLVGAKEFKMYSQYEYCPKCQSGRRMSVSIAIRTIDDAQGDDREVLMIRYHCESCLSFVRQFPLDSESIPASSPHPVHIPSVPAI